MRGEVNLSVQRSTSLLPFGNVGNKRKLNSFLDNEEPVVPEPQNKLLRTTNLIEERNRMTDNLDNDVDRRMFLQHYGVNLSKEQKMNFYRFYFGRYRDSRPAIEYYEEGMIKTDLQALKLVRYLRTESN